MLKKILTDKAPAPIGPYSQAVRVGDLLFISGQVAINPATGELETGTIEQETARVLDNLKAILRQESLGMDAVVKCSVFVKDINDFGRINAIYADYFDGHAPARELVEVVRLPKDANIEISLIAAYPS